MKLHVVGTGSNGNSYILKGNNSTLLIECGMPLKEVKKSLNFDISNIDGCIITHEHGDHAKYIKEFLSNSIEIYGSKGTKEALKINDYNYNEVKHGIKYTIGEFTVVPFNVVHDAKEPLGFLIHHEECGLVLFLTDTMYSKYKFKGLNNLIVEANFCEEIIKNKKNNDKSFLRDRILKSHLSIQKLIQMLNENDISQVNNIVLIHLSDRNSDKFEFKRKIELSTAKQTTVAQNGIIIDFNKTQF